MFARSRLICKLIALLLLNFAFATFVSAQGLGGESEGCSEPDEDWCPGVTGTPVCGMVKTDPPCTGYLYMEIQWDYFITTPSTTTNYQANGEDDCVIAWICEWNGKDTCFNSGKYDITKCTTKGLYKDAKC